MENQTERGKGKIMRYWYEGFDARRAGLDYSANPYGRGSAESAHWKSGWLSASWMGALKHKGENK